MSNTNNTQVSLKEQIAGFKSTRKVMDSDGQYTDCHGFYDWFCKDGTLARKSRRLMPKVIKFCTLMNIDLEKHYVFFKNNCPVNGTLYDDFRICDRESGDVIYNVTPRSGHTGMAEVYSQANGFNQPLMQADKFKNLFSAANTENDAEAAVEA